jgi:hypothetical protein
MHSTTLRNYTILHHGDYSGDVEIVRHVEDPLEADANFRVTVPADILFRFVADAVRLRRISQLENMTDQQILGLKD